MSSISGFDPNTSEVPSGPSQPKPLEPLTELFQQLQNSGVVIDKNAYSDQWKLEYHGHRIQIEKEPSGSRYKLLSSKGEDNLDSIAKVGEKIREALGLNKTERLKIDWDEKGGLSALAAPSQEEGVKALDTLDERIPGIDGICLLLDPVGDELNPKPDTELAIGSVFSRALGDKVPIVVSPHIILNFLRKYKSTGFFQVPRLIEIFFDNYSFYLGPNNSYCVMIPKIEDKVIPPERLGFANLKPLINDEKKFDQMISNYRYNFPVFSKSSEVPNAETLFIYPKCDSYLDLKQIFYKDLDPNHKRLRIALYGVGHGSIASKTTLNLPDHLYKDFLLHLNSVYNLSGVCISSCEPHGGEPRLDCVFIRRGIANLVTHAEAEYLGNFFRDMNQMTSQSNYKELETQLKKALGHVGQTAGTRMVVWYPSDISGGRARTEEGLNLTANWVGKQQIEVKHKEDKSVVIPPRIKELHLFVYDVDVDLRFEGDSPPFYSHIRGTALHKINSITLENPREIHSLDDFVEKSLAHNKIGNVETHANATQLFLIKTLKIGETTYTNVQVQLTPEGNSISYVGVENPPMLISSRDIARKCTQQRFLSEALEAIEVILRTEESEKITTLQTRESTLKSIQELFFPNYKWISYLASPTALAKYMDSQPDMEQSKRKYLLNYILDHDVFLEKVQQTGARYDLNLVVNWGGAELVYEIEGRNKEEIEKGLLRAANGHNGELRKLKMHAYFKPHKKNLFEHSLALDKAFANGARIDIVKLFLKSGLWIENIKDFKNILETTLKANQGVLPPFYKEALKLILDAQINNRMPPVIDSSVILLAAQGGADLSFFNRYFEKIKIPETDLEPLLLAAFKRPSDDLVSLMIRKDLIPKPPPKSILSSTFSWVASFWKKNTPILLDAAMRSNSLNSLIMLIDRGLIPEKVAFDRAIEIEKPEVLVYLLQRRQWQEKDLRPYLDKLKAMAFKTDSKDLYIYLSKQDKLTQESLLNDIRKAISESCPKILIYLYLQNPELQKKYFVNSLDNPFLISQILRNVPVSYESMKTYLDWTVGNDKKIPYSDHYMAIWIANNRPTVKQLMELVEFAKEKELKETYKAALDKFLDPKLARKPETFNFIVSEWKKMENVREWKMENISGWEKMERIKKFSTILKAFILHWLNKQDKQDIWNKLLDVRGNSVPYPLQEILWSSFSKDSRFNPLEVFEAGLQAYAKDHKDESRIPIRDSLYQCMKFCLKEQVKPTKDQLKQISKIFHDDELPKKLNNLPDPIELPNILPPKKFYFF